MARRQRRLNNKYSRVQKRIEKLLKSPLHELAAKLKGLTDFNHEQIIEYVSKMLERLPEEFHPHFYFDTWMIQSIVTSWGDDLTPNSRMIIPTYYNEWGYERIIIPDGSRVSFIHIPSEGYEIPSLLDYPWLCHELGHHLLSLSEHRQMLFDEFHPHLERLVSKLKRMSLSDRGLAKTQSQAVIDEIDAKWKSSEWIKELAIDVVALWTCGPAYLAAFEDEYENMENPFVIEPNHPPIELRTYALLQAARELDWNEYLEGLERIQEGWYKRIPPSIGNQYRSLSNTELIDQCVEAALIYCEGVRLPRLKRVDLDQIRSNLQRQNDFSNGIELIIAAWLSYQENKGGYNDWEKRTFNKLADEIVPESAK